MHKEKKYNGFRLGHNYIYSTTLIILPTYLPSSKASGPVLIVN